MFASSIGPRTLPVGLHAAVQVPATSANLGPGFDSLGMALDWADRSEVTVISGGLEFVLSGQGYERVPMTGDHLVIRTILQCLAEWDISCPGLRFESQMTIPLTRGLGSSSAAIVTGLYLAWALAYPGRDVDREWAFARAFELEGHGDNVGPAIAGGLTITWMSVSESETPAARLCSVPICSQVRATVVIPNDEVSTEHARSTLPSSVPMADAIANASRSALLIHALSTQPELLAQATSDRLHQQYRRALAPASYEVMSKLRELGFAAVISGAGPSVLILHREDESDRLATEIGRIPEASSMTVRLLRPGGGASLL